MDHLKKSAIPHQSAKPAYHLQHVHEKQIGNCSKSNPKHNTIPDTFSEAF